MLLWLVVSLMMILHFFILLSVGVITYDLRQALDLSALELSFLSSSYLYIYLILQTPAGILLDHFGARKILTIGVLVACFGCWIFSTSSNLYLSILARILAGGGLAFVFVGSIQLASRWFARRYFGMMIGFSEAAGMLGAITGNMLLAFFISTLGWRESYSLATIFGLVLAVCSWLIIRDYPENVKPSARSKLTVKKVAASVKALTREPQIWLQSIYIALMYEIVTVFSGLWANPFLRKAFDLDLEQATFACSLVLVGIGVGSPIAGILCESTRRRAICFTSCSIIMLFLMCILLYTPNLSYTMVNVLMLLLGFSGSSLILCFAVVSDVAPEESKSTSVGLTNSISLSSAIFLQPLIGLALNMLSDHPGSGAMEYYSANDYRIALSILPIMFFAAFIVSLFIARDFKLRQL